MPARLWTIGYKFAPDEFSGMNSVSSAASCEEFHIGASVFIRVHPWFQFRFGYGSAALGPPW